MRLYCNIVVLQPLLFWFHKGNAIVFVKFPVLLNIMTCSSCKGSNFPFTYMEYLLVICSNGFLKEKQEPLTQNKTYSSKFKQSVLGIRGIQFNMWFPGGSESVEAKLLQKNSPTDSQWKKQEIPTQMHTCTIGINFVHQSTHPLLWLWKLLQHPIFNMNNILYTIVNATSCIILNECC